KYVYTGPVRQSIRKIKYHGEYARASWHGQELAELVRECGWSADVIVPVPLHPARLKRRGFNQSEKLARAMGDVLGWETRSSLRRVRNTPSQTELHEQERRINVYGAFEAGGDISGLRV